MKRIIVLCSMLFFSINGTARDAVADLVIFSHKRPLQLYALLESIVDNVQGLGQVIVVCRANDDDYDQAYKCVHDDFCGVEFLKQTVEGSQNDFKQLTLQGVFGSPCEYILFAVDDMIVTDCIDLNECADLLKQTSAYAFYLRLGENITFSYQSGKTYLAVPGKVFNKNAHSWNFADGVEAWGYPHTVDMAMYKKADIENFFKTARYNNPNELEARWSKNIKHLKGRQGVCFTHSKVINVPLNRVQTTFANKNMKTLSPEKLLSLFNNGYKIDLRPLHVLDNNSTHIDYTFEFCLR